MPRPQNKSELIESSNKNYEQLLTLVDSCSVEEENMEFPPKYLNRNIRDVLAHLHHWHIMLLEWYQIGMKGETPAMPALGYTWKTVPDLNIAIQKKYTHMKLENIRILLHQSFKLIQDIIQRHTDEELFTKKKYKWTGTTSLGAYLVSATSSHYDWAIKLIKRAQKENLKLYT